MKSSRHAGREESSAGRATVAIPKRLRLAFPELALLFPLLVAGHQRGRSWRQTLDACIEPMTEGSLQRVAGEVDDLFSMSDDNETSSLLCLVLGLDLDVSEGEFPTLYQFVATIEERVSGDRLIPSSGRRLNAA